MNPPGRKEQFHDLFANEPAFRWEQIERALFDPRTQGFQTVSTIGKTMRDALEKRLPWMTVHSQQILESAKHDTYKAALSVEGEQMMESVLMANRRGAWTICVSSQVGCAMKCTFCATGTMGFKRNLTSDEIIDQYRFWMYFLRDHPTLPQRISNIVFMGMGEPMANYDNVKSAIKTLLQYTDLGPTNITVSTVGILPRLELLLNDREWPHVRLAVSLHSADTITRKSIVPTSYDDFLSKLADWSKRYLQTFGNRRHHLTFEYVLLSGVNDDDHHAKALAKFVNSIGNIRVNLIPWNATDAQFKRSSKEKINRMMRYLSAHGVTVTTRKTMGDDIAAACGQLVVKRD